MSNTLTDQWQSLVDDALAEFEVDCDKRNTASWRRFASDLGSYIYVRSDSRRVPDALIIAILVVTMIVAVGAPIYVAVTGPAVLALASLLVGFSVLCLVPLLVNKRQRHLAEQGRLIRLSRRSMDPVFYLFARAAAASELIEKAARAGSALARSLDRSLAPNEALMQQLALAVQRIDIDADADVVVVAPELRLDADPARRQLLSLLAEAAAHYQAAAWYLAGTTTGARKAERFTAELEAAVKALATRMPRD